MLAIGTTGAGTRHTHGPCRCCPRLKPIAAKIEEAPVRPVAAGQEENEEQKGAVHAGPVEKVRADEEEEDKGRRGIGRNEEER